MKMNFKKIVSLIIAIIMIATCTACANNKPIDDANSTQSTTAPETSGMATEPGKSFDTSEFLERPENDEVAIEVYRQEVKRRNQLTAKEESFVTDAERAYLEANGYDFHSYGARIEEYSEMYGELYTDYFPVIMKSSKGVELWYTNLRGEIQVDAIEGKCMDGWSSDYHGPLHYDTADGEEYIDCCESWVMVYNQSAGKVKVWSLEEVIDEFEVPEDAIYGGQSFWIGYLFRSGTDVYAAKYNAETETTDVYVIAHNVKMIIDADYAMGSDDWAQPLFLMTDGTVKGYCEWMGEEGAPLDDPSYLYDIRYEGGYDK